MNSYKKLFNNSIIFAVGNLGSKLINFFLVPLYTYYLSPDEYGIIDLVIASIAMLLPIVSVSMYDAVMRFAMDKRIDKSATLTNSLFISCIGILALLMFYPVLHYATIFEGYLNATFIVLSLNIFHKLFSQYARGASNTKVFAFSGVLLTLGTGLFNILFIVIFKLGVNGYFLALIVAYLISIVYLMISLKIVSLINLKKLNIKLMKELSVYSFPLIPNAIMWQLINSSSKFFIVSFAGVAANGLFAVSNKIPALINLVTQVFSQAWQLSAIEEIESKNNDKFYSNIFSLLSIVLILTVFSINIILRPLFYYAFSEEYFSAWKAVPLLLLGVMFSSFSSYFGGFYVATKETKGLFTTSIIGGIISLLLNWILIPIIGIQGAGVSQLVSFFSMFIIRYMDTKNLVSVKVNWRELISNLALIFIQTFILLLSTKFYIFILCSGILLIIFIVINFKYFKQIFKIVVDIFKSRILKK